jgi:hypothetical protein
LLDADPAKKIAVLGAVWVDAPPRLYVEQVKNIEQFERGGEIAMAALVGLMVGMAGAWIIGWVKRQRAGKY